MFNQCRKNCHAVSTYCTLEILHTRKKPYRDVGRAFVNQSYSWIQAELTIKRLYKWKECGKTSGHSTSFRAHGPAHTANKCYRCEDSGKVSTASLSHRQHIKTHTGEKPFQCDTCGKAFSFPHTFLFTAQFTLE